MCTDVDRNDKSRICEPGSVRIVGRRQIELYSRLIHTVDHVHGRLRAGYGAWDAFLTHMWAATVTGAPKRAAAGFIEDHEESPRRRYGGAVGYATFDGNMNTGLTLRAARLAGEFAEVRAGATLLIGSDPEAEEQETRLKAAAVLGALAEQQSRAMVEPPPRPDAANLRVLLVDHEDSFVHTLADYIRECGCSVLTRRWSSVGQVPSDTDLVVLSAGPGRPRDFRVSDTITSARQAGAALFGVCLGLQGIVEYYGGSLELLPAPVHGKASDIVATTADSVLFRGLPNRFRAGRYHSLYVRSGLIPAALRTTAITGDGIVMAIEHRQLPMYAVQFHPESLLTLNQDFGRRLIRNVVAVAGAARSAVSA